MDLISLESSKLESFFKTPLRSLASCSGDPTGGGRGLSALRIPLGWLSDSEKDARRESVDEEEWWCLRMDRGLSRWPSRDPPELSRFRIPAGGGHTIRCLSLGITFALKYLRIYGLVSLWTCSRRGLQNGHAASWITRPLSSGATCVTAEHIQGNR